MDYKQFRKNLAGELGRDARDIDALVQGLSIIIRESCADLDTVAIPAFGNFIPKKHDEEISIDLSTGKRMLMPPEITIDFVPSNILRKQLGHE